METFHASTGCIILFGWNSSHISCLFGNKHCILHWIPLNTRHKNLLRSVAFLYFTCLNELVSETTRMLPYLANMSEAPCTPCFYYSVL